jgi:surface carbohydrate biosynthesis protein
MNDAASGGMATAPILYLPVEVAARELDAKLLITYFAVAAGFEVIIGQKWLLQRNLGRMPPGIMMFKTLTAVDAKFMQAARGHGFLIASIDEEIPGLIARNEGLRWVAPAAVEACDLIFAVGDEHAQALLERYPSARDKCAVVGNPRWDLLRHEFIGAHDQEVARIHRDHGRFLLINTNLGFINSGKGTTEQMVRKLERGGKFDRRKPEDSEFLAQHLRLERASFSGIKALLPRLAATFPGHQIIVRPHPSENASTWKAAVAGMPRTQVVRRGAAVPWILASDCLIHTYCTTGVEAFALGKPAICFQPDYARVIENYLSPRINFLAESVEAVVAHAKAVVDADGAAFAYPAASRATFDRSFAARSGAFAAERIVQQLAERFRAPLWSVSPRIRWRPGRGYVRYVLSKAHNKRLMPAVTTADLADRLDRFGMALGASRRFAIEPCGDRVFHVHGDPGSVRTADTAGQPTRLLRWVKRLAGGTRAS